MESMDAYMDTVLLLCTSQLIKIVRSKYYYYESYIASMHTC
jgi:hypothetical protein